jgi:hypothetical protein
LEASGLEAILGEIVVIAKCHRVPKEEAAVEIVEAL